jgi:hypothetical protein
MVTGKGAGHERKGRGWGLCDRGKRNSWVTHRKNGIGWTGTSGFGRVGRGGFRSQ